MSLLRFGLVRPGTCVSEGCLREGNDKLYLEQRLLMPVSAPENLALEMLWFLLRLLAGMCFEECALCESTASV